MSIREWTVTGYMPSYKQFSLPESLTPERITDITKVEPRPSKDGKCKHQWEFYATTWLDGADGEPVQVTLPCSIWDFKGSRWSGYGPPDAFRQLGLLPAQNEGV